MVAVLTLVSSLVAVASSVQAGVIPHHHRALTFARATPPEGWVTEIMEPYNAYNARYNALSCETKHDTAFFDLCCHPMKVNETLATARDASCDPANLTSAVSSATATSKVVASAAATTSAAAPAVSNVASSSNDDDEDCDDEDDSGDDDEEDCDDDDETTSAAVAATSAAHTTKAAVTTTAAAKPTTTKVAKPATSSAVETASAEPTSAAAKPTTTAEAQPTTTKKATSTHASSTAKATSTAASSSGDDSGDFITGGKATFFTQDGGEGSCGVFNKDSTPLVAVQASRMNSSLCGKKVEVVNVANGKSVTAIIQDTCPTCQYNPNSLDLSTGAFNAIADPALGVVDIKWKIL